MKKILITGKNSYIGVSFEKWLSKESEKYIIDTVDTRNGVWREKDFSFYDVVFHVAGIAHVKEDKKNYNLYFEINRDMAYEIAEKAKLEGVKQFIFLSSMSVYGVEEGIISNTTPLKPKSAYGISKKEAEHLINSLKTDSFRVAILRPPMVYGPDCKGNYPRLAKLAVRAPFFPDINNKRSMIYIDNLTELIKYLIDNYSDGLFMPQDSEYINTSEMVKIIANLNGKKIKLINIFNPVIALLNFSVVKKVFGDLVYEKELSDFQINYHVSSFEESLEEIETRAVR